MVTPPLGPTALMILVSVKVDLDCANEFPAVMKAPPPYADVL
jgi:hypothetical protein